MWIRIAGDFLRIRMEETDPGGKKKPTIAENLRQNVKSNQVL